MSRLGQVWQIGIGYHNEAPDCYGTYVIVEEAPGGYMGVIIEAPPSCQYLLCTRVLLPHDWFLREHDHVSRVA